MNKSLPYVVLAIGLILSLAIIGFASVAKADEDVIDLVPVAVEEPEAIPDPRPVVVNSHELDPEDVEKLARLLWSSPLRYEGYKKALVWVVMNRAEHGDPFGTSIQDCINMTEFRFFDSHAHRSDENLRIVRQAMNEWLSRKEGENVGVQIPLNAYYIQFYGDSNRRMKVLDIDMNELSWSPLK